MTWFAIAQIAFLASCSLKLPNLEVCRDKGLLGAHCAFTNDGESFDLDRDEWDNRRFGNFCMSEEDFAANQKFIEQACEQAKGCDIEKLRKKIKAMHKRLGMK